MYEFPFLLSTWIRLVCTVPRKMRSCQPGIQALQISVGPCEHVVIGSNECSIYLQHDAPLLQRITSV